MTLRNATHRPGSEWIASLPLALPSSSGSADAFRQAYHALRFERVFAERQELRLVAVKFAEIPLAD